MFSSKFELFQHNPRRCMLLSPSSSSSQRWLASTQCADVDNQPRTTTPERRKLDHCIFPGIRLHRPPHHRPHRQRRPVNREFRELNKGPIVKKKPALVLRCMLLSPSSSSSQRWLASTQCADVDNQPRTTTPERRKLDHCIFPGIRLHRPPHHRPHRQRRPVNRFGN
ncbi:hypothetical protein TYRP_023495 [Tyrophagus putrescentiae]|nr:hypothetical protein TYRP_023495 [Tyrophagus putrescentiae]